MFFPTLDCAGVDFAVLGRFLIVFLNINCTPKIYIYIYQLYSESPQTLLWVASCENYFPTYHSAQGSVHLPVMRSWFSDGVILNWAVMLAICMLLWAGRTMERITVPTWNCSLRGLWRFCEEQVVISGKRHYCWVFQMYFGTLSTPRWVHFPTADLTKTSLLTP